MATRLVDRHRAARRLTWRWSRRAGYGLLLLAALFPAASGIASLDFSGSDPPRQFLSS